jgi:hypothetical protein
MLNSKARGIEAFEKSSGSRHSLLAEAIAPNTSAIVWGKKRHSPNLTLTSITATRTFLLGSKFHQRNKSEKPTVAILNVRPSRTRSLTPLAAQTVNPN